MSTTASGTVRAGPACARSDHELPERSVRDLGRPHIACLDRPAQYPDQGLSKLRPVVRDRLPTTQPVYGLTSTCPGLVFCSYGSTRCSCLQTGTPWICGLGVFLGPPTGP